ncbi:metal-dependent hydrolase [Haloplanus halobius]|uniref:metal-dependent hydrolase n=1 Tax=Haloplanus halobius TaxID=2934938 RepID=UPI0020104A3B|nr:metal-dependent hydrolase [Haloplanus sp. XH21]
MMLPTHALAGMLLALPVALAMPEFAGVALLAGFLGGVVPDADLYAGHRRTLHYPVYYSALVPAGVLALAVWPSVMTVALAVFLLAAAAHSVADVFGGGLELRPWEATSNRAVYDHYNRRWVAPRHWIRYDGAPSDLALSVALAAPLLFVVGPSHRWLVTAALVVAVVYATVRRTLPSVVERLVGGLPTWLLAYLPARYCSPDHVAVTGHER